MAELATGAVIAGYRIEGVAGKGGMGIVYRATQLALDRPVALKLIAADLADDTMFRERFKRESHTAASIDHPNVIPVYEAGEADGQLFIAMRYVEGIDLRELIRREGRVPPKRAIRIVEQVAAALDAAHRRGLVHRDVKPANALITEDGDEHVYLTDFGLTKHAASVGGMTATGQFVGTVDYSAPEQIKGERSDARTDVYALGCMLFQTLSGRVPYERDSEIAKIYAHLNDPPPSLVERVGDLDGPLDDVIQRAMAKEPDDRFPSCGDLSRAARAALAGGTASVPERTVAAGAAAASGDGEGAVPTVPAAAPPTAPGGEPPTAQPAEPPTAQPAEPASAPAAETPATAADTPATAAETPATAPDRPAPGAETPATTPVAPRPGQPTAAAKAPQRAGRRPGLLVALGVVALVVGAVAVFTLGSGGDDEGGGGGGGEGGSGRPEVTATIPVGPGPDGVAVGSGKVWVSLAESASVRPVDPGTNRAGERVSVGDNPDAVAAADDVVWVSITGNNEVRRIEGAGGTPRVGASAAVGTRPEGIALGQQLVWVVNSGDNTVSRIDRAQAQPLPGPVGVGSQPVGVFVGPESVWVTNNGDNTVTRINSSSSQVVGDPIPVGAKPRGVVEGGGSVWVANTGEDSVTQIDARTGEVVKQRIQVGDGPREVAFGAGSVWVTNSAGNSVSRIDPGSGTVSGSPIAVGSQPIGIAVGEGAVWVANLGDDSVTRIDP